MSASAPEPAARRRHSEGARLSSRTPGTSPAAKRSGTVRFDPYWKLSVWVPRSVSWQEAKGSYATEAAAVAAARRGVEHRLVRVAPGLPGGREVVRTFTP